VLSLDQFVSELKHSNMLTSRNISYPTFIIPHICINAHLSSGLAMRLGSFVDFGTI